MSHLLHAYNCTSFTLATFICFALQSSCVLPLPSLKRSRIETVYDLH
jgi:hypothetical protein